MHSYVDTRQQVLHIITHTSIHKIYTICCCYSGLYLTVRSCPNRVPDGHLEGIFSVGLQVGEFIPRPGVTSGNPGPGIPGISQPIGDNIIQWHSIDGTRGWGRPLQVDGSGASRECTNTIRSTGGSCRTSKREYG